MRIVSKGLKFTYNKKTEFKRHALNGVDLVIEEGDFFGIIGQTGSGKSTFIQHLNGLIKVQEGELYVGDFNLTPTKKKNKGENLKLLRSRVGMVFQYPEYQLFAETVFEDVAFGLKNFYPNLSQEDISLKVKKALELVGLDYYEVKDRSPFELSGGQKRRIAIAGVIVLEPEVLVLDEPVAGLDPVGKKSLMKLLHTLHNDKIKTIIIVSHDMDEVNENCNRIAVFNGGKVVKCDEVNKLFDNATFFEENGLELPLNAKIVHKLRSLGVNLNGDYKTENIIKEINDKFLNR